jgi:cation transport regulator ChaB
MAKYTILNWQDLPSLVEATDEEGSHKIQLSQRFQALIDHVAMESGLMGSDAYLDAWNRTNSQEREGTAEDVAKAIVEEVEAQFSDIMAAHTNKG